MPEDYSTPKQEAILRLIAHSKNDPQFFHDLIWNTEKALDSLDYLTRQEKAFILAINPEDLVVGLATGALIDRGIVATYDSCGPNCGGSSCGMTCGDTCEGSCRATCNTSSGLPWETREITNPVDYFTANYTLSNQIKKQLKKHFSIYSRG